MNVLTTNLTTHINQSNVRLDSQDRKGIKSDSMNKINTNLNETVENPFKGKKVSNSETQKKVKLTHQNIVYRAVATP